MRIYPPDPLTGTPLAKAGHNADFQRLVPIRSQQESSPEAEGMSTAQKKRAAKRPILPVSPCTYNAMVGNDPPTVGTRSVLHRAIPSPILPSQHRQLSLRQVRHRPDHPDIASRLHHPAL